MTTIDNQATGNVVESVFAKYQERAWPFTYHGVIRVRNIAGGVPSDPKVAEGWIRSKIVDSDEAIRELVAKTMVERGITADEAAAEVDTLKHLNGFKRNSNGLYIEGRQLKAALKEAANVAVASGKIPGRSWGRTNKGLLSFLAEHVHVMEDTLPLLVPSDPNDLSGERKYVTEPTGVIQRFVHTWRGSGISYEEYVDECDIQFTVRTDWEFEQKDKNTVLASDEETWAMIWLTGQEQGIGSSRSQGHGRYTVLSWSRDV